MRDPRAVRGARSLTCGLVGNGNMRARAGHLQGCTRAQARACARISFVWPAFAHAKC